VLEAFVVEDGAAMMVASMIDPPPMIHPSRAKISGLRPEQLLPDLVGFEQVSDVEQRGRVRDPLDREVQA